MADKPKARDKWARRFMARHTGAGKGDMRRPVDKQKFDEGYERIFGRRELKTWTPEDDPRKENDGADDGTGTPGGTAEDAGTPTDSLGGADGRPPERKP